MQIRLKHSWLAVVLPVFWFTSAAQADVIDPFTFAQGPFTVGPGEEISEEQATVFTDTVLGGFRVALPVVGDDSAGGSTATLDITGGTLECGIDFPNVDEENNSGGCASGYDRGEGQVFDLSAVTQFEFDVIAVEGGMSLGVTLVDTDLNLSIALIQGVSAGMQSVPVNQFLSPTLGTPADLSKIDNIAITIINDPGEEGSITLGSFGTDGAITGGPVIENPDMVEAEEISGTWTNFSRDGEGCQLTLERDGVTFILTCYLYVDGKQFWLIDIGVLIDDQIAFSNLVMTSGADFGADFDPDDVMRTTWGTGVMTFTDCNTAELAVTPVLGGYEPMTFQFTRLVPATCGNGGLATASATKMGTWAILNRDGEGFQLTVEGDGTIYVITWYTYLDGEQVWLIGSATGDDGIMVFDNVVVTRGTGFGSEFNPGDVERIPFGTITLDFTDCNNAAAEVETVLPEFSDIDLDVKKLLEGLCP